MFSTPTSKCTCSRQEPFNGFEKGKTASRWCVCIMYTLAAHHLPSSSNFQGELHPTALRFHSGRAASSTPPATRKPPTCRFSPSAESSITPGRGYPNTSPSPGTRNGPISSQARHRARNISTFQHDSQPRPTSKEDLDSTRPPNHHGSRTRNPTPTSPALRVGPSLPERRPSPHETAPES